MGKDSTAKEKWNYKISKQYLNNPEDSTSLPSNHIRYGYETDRNVIWLGGYFGLSRYNAEKDNFTTYNVLSKRNSSYPNAVIQIFQYNTDDIWFATIGDSETFGILNQKTGKTEFISLHNNEIDYYTKIQLGSSSNGIFREVVIDDDGTFWIPSFGGGLMHYNPETGNFKSYIHDSQNPKSLSFGANQTSGLCKDYAGVIWLGVELAGIDRLSRPKPFYKHFKFDENMKNESGYEKTIYQIYEDSDGILWLGTLEGLSRIDRVTNSYIYYKHDPADPYSICDNRISHIMEDRDGYLWLATSNGLSKFDKKKNRFSNFYNIPGDSTSLPPGHMLVCLFEDSNGDIYIGTAYGLLSKYVKSKNTFVNYFKSQDPFTNKDTLGIIGEIRIDEEGYVWFTSGGYLNKFDPAKGLIEKYYFDDLYVENNASGLFYDSKGRFWIGRRSGGLLKFDKKGISIPFPQQDVHLYNH